LFHQPLADAPSLKVDVSHFRAFAFVLTRRRGVPRRLGKIREARSDVPRVNFLLFFFIIYSMQRVTCLPRGRGEFILRMKRRFSLARA